MGMVLVFDKDEKHKVGVLGRIPDEDDVLCTATV